MPREAPHVVGELRAHPAAAEFSREVQRVHHRYANEVVKAFRLCPFLRDAESAFGYFCVVLDREPVLATALAASLAAKAEVAHLVYPLARPPARAFELFAAALVAELKGAIRDPPVFAAFHPDLPGDRATTGRLVGLLRRAPDPFVQLVPEGLQPGGTVLADVGVIPDSLPKRGVEMLTPDAIDRLLAALEEIRADRDRSYAPYLAALAL